MNDRDEIIGLLEHVEACLEDTGSAVFLDLQEKVREARERLIKEGLGFIYCLDDEAYFDWANKVRESFEPLKSFQLTLEIELRASGNCDAQMQAKEMVDNYLDHRARLTEIKRLAEMEK